MRHPPLLTKLGASTPCGRYARGHKVGLILGRRQFNLLVTAGCLFAPTVHSAMVEPQKVRLGLSMRTSMLHLPLVLAEQMGYFRTVGIQLEWHDGETDAQVHQALTSGQVDVVSGAFEQVLDLNEQGHKTKAFVLQGRTPQISLGVALRRWPSYQSLADLKRFKIGVPDWGSSGHAMAQLWCLRAGLNPRDMQFVEVGSMGQAMDQLRSGAVDALCHLDPLMRWLEHKSELRLVAETRSLQGTQLWMGGPTATTCLFAKIDFLKLKPELIQGLTDGVVRALKWLITAGPTDLLKVMPVHAWMGDRAFYLGTVEALRESYCPDGLFAQEWLQNAWHNRATRSGLPKSQGVDRVALQAAFTHEAVQKSKQRFAL